MSSLLDGCVDGWKISQLHVCLLRCEHLPRPRVEILVLFNGSSSYVLKAFGTVDASSNLNDPVFCKGT